MTTNLMHNTKHRAHITILNWYGTPQTLSDGPQAYDLFKGNGRILVLGLGPEPAQVDLLIKGLPHPVKNISYMECHDFAKQMPGTWRTAIPDTWQNASPYVPDTNKARGHQHPAELVRQHIQHGGTIIIYRQNVRLFPNYWGPLTGAAQAARLCPPVVAARPAGARGVILAGSHTDLLVHELHNAFAQLGCSVRVLPPENIQQLPHMLREERPKLFLSINFKGLDPWGERFHLLDASGVNTAVWCVDNPWHLVSGIKSPFWKKIRLFITDQSFIAGLQNHGAASVYHLPLATMPELFLPASHEDVPVPAMPKSMAHRLVFVGRSAFPHKQQFFAGCTYPKQLMAHATASLDAGKRPHYHWWATQLGLHTLWPDKAARTVGYAAEETARTWRIRCLQSCAQTLGPHTLTVFGDEEWQTLLPPSATVLPPVDYYTELPYIYTHAGAVLNMTSLLLPHGLTQRHFDVWAAGGLCLSDNTPGMALFPTELTREVTFTSPNSIKQLYTRAMEDRAWRTHIISAWQHHILSVHTYVHRIQTLWEHCVQ